MALPPAFFLTSLQDCASYEQTVAPFHAHLQHLLYLPEIRDFTTLRDLYASTNPCVSGLALTLALMPVFFIVSEVNKNYSQVDRVWSLLPTLYHAHYCLWAHVSHVETARVDAVLAFSAVWSARLTFNYWRKGGYQVGSEDYRWNIIKDYIGKWGLVALNVVFISTAQLILLWAITTPTYLLLLVSHAGTAFTPADLAFVCALLGIILIEFIADQQQWNYHQAKGSYHDTAKVPAGWTRAQMERGFITTGLWRYSRHPNFAAEQSVWIVLYMWGCWATYTAWNWTFFGVLGYLLVFQGSTPLTEWISGSKYPEYRVYRQRVGKFVPSVLGKGWDERVMEKLGARMAEGEKKRVNGGKAL